MKGKTEMKSRRYSNERFEIKGLTPKGVKVVKVVTYKSGKQKRGKQQTINFLTFINQTKQGSGEGEIPLSLAKQMPYDSFE